MYIIILVGKALNNMQSEIINHSLYVWGDFIFLHK